MIDRTTLQGLTLWQGLPLQMCCPSSEVRSSKNLRFFVRTGLHYRGDCERCGAPFDSNCPVRVCPVSNAPALVDRTTLTGAFTLASSGHDYKAISLRKPFPVEHIPPLPGSVLNLASLGLCCSASPLACWHTRTW